MMKTLKGKISLIYIGLVFLIALVGGISVMNLVVLQRSVNGLMTDNYISISAMEGARTALSQQKDAILQYVDLNDGTGIDRYYDYDQAFQKAFQMERDDVTESGEQKIVDSVNTNYSDLEREFSQFQNIRDVKGKPQAADYYKTTLEPQITKINAGLDQITSLNQNAMFLKKSTASEDARTSLYIILIISMIAVTGGFLLSRYLVNRFLRPIHLLTESISKVRAGELNMKLDVKTGDETEKLIHEFNEMISRLSAFEKSTMGTLMDEKNKSVAIVKSISDLLIVLDHNYKIVMVNNACEQFFDFAESKMLGNHFLEAIRDGELFNFITGSVESGKTICEKVLYFEKDKGYYFNVVITQNSDAEHNSKGCIVLMQNVTEFKELERIKTDFVATVSHEFKTPLTSIIMGASMLEGGNLGIVSEEQMDVVKAIIEDGERLSGFVTELLEVSKLESGKAVYSFEPCSLSAIIESSVRQFSETAGRENVTIENDVEEDLPRVYADFERVTWVMNNLLSNALKYTRSGDFITISAKRKDNIIETSVKDTGDGIPPEYLDRIFDKFVQVKGHDIEARGTGLGLAVAKEIVTAHRGKISVESEMDAGSTFRFTLPLFQDSIRESCK
jgi:PAS domain S-box-containing protein